MPVNITVAASEKIEDLCRKFYPQHVRLAILSGGCNGYSKSFSLDENVNGDDMVFRCHTGKLIIDEISYQFLENATVDYKTGLVGSYFDVEIPETESVCGCGNSFSK